MNIEAKLIETKLGFLKLSEELGNVSQAYKGMGVIFQVGVLKGVL